MAEAKKDDDYEMEYRMLGNTGLKVSTLGFGFWATFGGKAGINLFDYAVRSVWQRKWRC